jgi:hypothetical protein
MNMFALFVAYVLAAHYVGRDMSSLQVVAVTSLYSIFALTPVTSTISSIIQFHDLAAGYQASFPHGVIKTLSPRVVLVFAIIPLITFSFAWLLSLAYMLSLRHSKIE